MLGALGYHVTVTNSSLDALQIFKSSPDSFDLLISDVTMPEMTGDVLVSEIRNIRPELPVLLCSGYSEKLTMERMKDINLKNFLMKPLMLKEMAFHIRIALDERLPEN